ncbi:MAG TPA: V-type ATP synthase subunit A [Steroidobacteraceae bacterium]|nr:V-type ATP synthase subunit A [Steroidobacteraceae bacterium]
MSEARIRWISGPVLRAGTKDAFHVNESITVGPNALLGEVIKLGSGEFVAQIYEDTTGLKPGDSVAGTGEPLSIALGPNLLGTICDGLLRPLDAVDGAFIRPGATRRAPRRFGFEPAIASGDRVRPGQVIGRIATSPAQFCLCPPSAAAGVASWVAAAGEYADQEPVCRLEIEGRAPLEIALTQYWPVREPRPVAQRLPISGPMITGQRILDTLFPIGRGSRAALPGGFGTGKTILQQALARWSDADVIIYVGCGERGNEMSEVLDELPKLQDPRSGRPLMERTVIIANTSNMPVAAREASIYTAITVAEYYRDQGMHVSLMADSTSRWAEALREVSGRLGELPGEAGYPAYLSSRLAQFYERAGRVSTLSGAEGSVTIIGAISPPAGDFTEPVTMHTRRFVRCFWALDRSRAQARFFPAIHPLQSYSADVDALAHWWQAQGNPDWLAQRTRLLELLESQVRLESMARIVGKDALPPAQQLTLLCADLVNDAVLRQSSFSETDRYCSPQRQTEILRVVIRFIDVAREAVEAGVHPERIADLPVRRTLQRIGEEFGETRIEQIRDLWKQLDAEFSALRRERTDAR